VYAGCRVQGSGCRVQGSGSGVQGVGLDSPAVGTAVTHMSAKNAAVMMAVRAASEVHAMERQAGFIGG
jgi:hypothetical protein